MLSSLNLRFSTDWSPAGDIFISMNDDFIINRLTKPSDFYTPDEGIRVYVENGDARDMKSEAQWPMSEPLLRIPLGWSVSDGLF